MNSIGARLAFWYSLASTLTFACLFLAGRYFLERHAIHALDLMNAAEFEQVKSRLGPDAATLTPDDLRLRLRSAMANDSVLFYVEIHDRDAATVFRSSNLRDRAIPLVAGQDAFNAPVEGLGELRAGRFPLGPLTVVVATSKRHIRQLVMIGYERNFYILTALMFVVSIAIGYGVSRVALRPLRLIQETASRIGSHNLSARVPVGDVRDELSDLARLLNQMFDRLETAFEQTRRFTADASHELKTPLSLLRLQAEKLALEGGLKPAQEEAVHMQLEEIARLNQIIEELLFLSRAEARAITLQTRAQDPRPFLESFGIDARVLAEARGMHFSERIGGAGAAAFDAKWIRQVLLNLLANALNASPPGGRVTLTSELDATTWRVALEDEGPGVPAEQRERIFDRFVRLGQGKENGSGLGLAILRSIVGLHRGVIRTEAATGGRGLRVVFELPAAGGAPSAT
ncbi:MAG: HAMP domain-containing protein [Opitutus sp.]|nr:HAMP domain-containing protein [Opitutus sp.]